MVHNGGGWGEAIPWGLWLQDATYPELAIQYKLQKHGHRRGPVPMPGRGHGPGSAHGPERGQGHGENILSSKKQ